MKILQINTWDTEGGAARGAYWMHQGLLRLGIDSNMLVCYKSSVDPTIFSVDRFRLRDRVQREIQLYFNYTVLRRYPQQKVELFSPARVGENIEPKLRQINPDLVNLHWICCSFLTPEAIAKINKPLVWTLRDIWGMTGGCHYFEDCTRYQDRCGRCPLLGSTKEEDLSRQVWQRKYKAWQNLDITIVAVSQWVADCARRSSLFRDRRIEVIHNAIDTDIFKPRDRSTVRSILELPQNRNIIAFVALNATRDRRKGFEYLVSALQQLAANGWGETTEAIVIGANPPENPPDLGLKTTYLGRFNDNITLAMAYGSADAVIVPSLQDACPKTPIEALACGTPVVCFDTSGLKDIVSHQENGYRAECFNSEDLAAGIAWVLEDKERWRSLSDSARTTAETQFSTQVQARSYRQLYQDILQRST